MFTFSQKSSGTKQDKEFIRNIQTEDELIYYNYWNKNPNFEKYLYNLRTNAEYRKTIKQNSKRFVEPFKDSIKRFRMFEVILIALVGISVTTTGTVYLDSKHGDITQTNTGIAKDLALLIIFALACMTVTCLVNVDLVRSEREKAIQTFYNHLVIRCFKLMKVYSKDLDKETLREYNPALAYAVSTLMMANMPEKETKKIHALVDDIINKEFDFTEDYLAFFDKQLKSAMKIMEKAFRNNPELYREMLKIYHGKAPSVFVLNPNQNVR